jgi:hypothetical protein
MTTDQATGRFDRRLVSLRPGILGTIVVCTLAVCWFAAGGCADRTSPAATTTASEAAAARTESTSETTAKNEPAAAKPDQQRTRDISFDTVKFDMQKDEPFQRKMITPAIENIANTKIRIRGYILPSFQQSGLAQFVLVRDNMQCCFGPGAALYDCIVVQMSEGKSTNFTIQPVAVEGTFSIQEVNGADGKCLAIYHMQADKVQ